MTVDVSLCGVILGEGGIMEELSRTQGQRHGVSGASAKEMSDDEATVLFCKLNTYKPPPTPQSREFV